MTTAGHVVGSWFLTSVRFLEEFASTLRLSIREVMDVGDVG
jgi:hypothetical protein